MRVRDLLKALGPLSLVMSIILLPPWPCHIIRSDMSCSLLYALAWCMFDRTLGRTLLGIIRAPKSKFPVCVDCCALFADCPLCRCCCLLCVACWQFCVAQASQPLIEPPSPASLCLRPCQPVCACRGRLHELILGLPAPTTSTTLLSLHHYSR